VVRQALKGMTLLVSLRNPPAPFAERDRPWSARLLRARSENANLVNGVIDILVDISVLKEHCGPGTSYGFGSCSLCMKGHLGTFINAGTDSTPSSTGLHVLEAVFNINKHAAILGGNPVRQQLCIVDGLLANNGNSATWNVRTDRIVMGTFAPIVDYLTATKLLLDSIIMAAAPMPAPGVTSAALLLPQYLTSFGYAATDPDWVAYEAGSPPAITGGGGTGGATGSTGSGGSKASGGSIASNGGSTANGGSTGSTGSGGSKASGGATANNGGSTAGNGGSTANGGSIASNGGTSEGQGMSGGGALAAGGITGNGGAASGGVRGTGGAATSSASASGGSATPGGTSPGTGTGANSTGGSTGTTGATASHGNSGSGCSVAGVDRGATRWGALLAFGAAVAERFRRLASGGDRSS
jgi:hypothetical protein